jgi:hypothetical protein
MSVIGDGENENQLEVPIKTPGRRSVVTKTARIARRAGAG